MKRIFIAGAYLFFATIATAQNVGIGTTTPVTKLNIVGNSSSPAIPGATSSGVFRIGISVDQGIDFGKLSTTPYAAWMQSGFGGVIPDPLSLQPLGGNVGIGTISPQFSAVLDVSSTTKGFLPPRMTSMQRNAIASPVAGLTIYNTTKKGLEYYNGSSWNSTAHYIGESYGGGIVFFVYDGGQHGLIASTTDQQNDIVWDNQLVLLGATADGLGAGTKNSIILQAKGFFPASRFCYDYSVSDGTVTYGDWYLPSKYELNLLYLQKNIVGGFDTFLSYYSSTEINANDVWMQNFGSGFQIDIGKTAIFGHVRAIRAF